MKTLFIFALGFPICSGLFSSIEKVPVNKIVEKGSYQESPLVRLRIYEQLATQKIADQCIVIEDYGYRRGYDSYRDIDLRRIYFGYNREELGSEYCIENNEKRLRVFKFLGEKIERDIGLLLSIVFSNQKFFLLKLNINLIVFSQLKTATWKKTDWQKIKDLTTQLINCCKKTIFN